MRTFPILFAYGAMAVASPLAAQSIGQAIEAGQVGERFDGYMGIVGTPSPELRRQVAGINLRRRNLYIELSGRRNVSPQVVGTATACQLLSQIPVGGTYMLSDGAWRRRGAGQPAPLPDYCR